MKTKISTLIIALTFIQLSISQTVYTVDNRPESGAQYPTVAAAIAAASAGDIIYIHPSPTNYGSFSLDKSLTIKGGGHDPASYNGTTSAVGTITVRANTANSVITGLRIGRIDAISFANSNAGNIHIINNRIATTSTGIQGYTNGSGTPGWVIEGNFFDDLYFRTNINVTNSADWKIQNNVIHGEISNARRSTVITNNLFINEDPADDVTIFTNVNDITSPIVTNNMFVFTDPDVTTIVNTGSTPVTYTNCLTWKAAGGANLTILSGNGNLDNTNPIFNSIPSSLTDFYNNDYTLGAGSLAIDAATDGGDIGIFGRNFPYDNTGRPHSMPYPTEMIILNTVVQPGQDLNVTFKAAQKN